ncbi:MAG: tyrosine-type recombinase/integrase, partial [Oscillospiraceae bacterium]|nr:tyrosine-type recombinase/integrase [Oscillospiraceae bacterium]
KTVDSKWIFPSPLDNNKTRNPSAVRKRLQLILERANCKRVRFHDLRHTFSTMALEHGMDIKTLSATIGHVSAATTLDIYSHITDTMQKQAAVNIDRKIGKTDAMMPEQENTQAQTEKPPVSDFEPYVGKIRKPGTGCVTMINDHLYEGRFTPTGADGKRISKNIYADTREECEEKLAELIVRMKAEIAEEKARRKSGRETAINESINKNIF